MIYFKLTNNNSNNNVYIISDFKCPVCQKAEQTVQRFIQKYKNTINFRFIIASDYIDKGALACYAANKQNKFKQMHDLIFRNSNLEIHDSSYYVFAEEIKLDMKIFNTDINNPKSLKKLILNKEQLISKGIYSTPTFIVNGKILDGKYAIDYLEDVIINEYRLGENEN